MDGLRVRDAINLYLKWAEERGRIVTLGDLTKELVRHRVVSFRNKPLSEQRYPFKSITNALGLPSNKQEWHVDRRDPEGHHTAADTIKLKHSRKSHTDP